MTRRLGPVAISASSSSDRSSLRALFSPRFDERPELAHKVFATEPAPSEDYSHWAEVILDQPVDIAGVAVRWPEQLPPQSFTVSVRVEGRWIDLGAATESDDEEWTWCARVRTDGVRLEQPPRGGHTRFVDTMRIRGVALLPPDDVGTALVLGGGQVVPVAMPVLTEWCGAAVVDVSDAYAVRFPHVEGPLALVVLTVSRLGDSGHPDDVEEWAASLRSVRVRRGDDWSEVAVQATVDRSDAGVVCGVVRVVLRVSEPTTCDEVEVDLPSRGGSLLALVELRTFADGEELADLRSSSARPSDERAACFALPIGTDGDGARFAVTATGLLQLKFSSPVRSRGRALLVRPSDEPLAPIRFAGDAGVVLTGEVRAYSVEPATADGRHLLALTVPAFDAGMSLSIVAVDGPDPLSCRWSESRSVVFCDGEPILRADGRVRIRVNGDELHVLVDGTRVELLGEPSSDVIERAPAKPSAVAAVEPQVCSLVSELGRFRGADGRVCYGRYPSPYHGMIFGLEEDYGFFGAMLWGAEAFAIESFSDTYLDPRHLDPDHYLHDLRHCLLPWQMWRLCRLAERDVDSLFGERGRAALAACGIWIRSERAKTANAIGAVDPGGVRVFPGLLPPGRFGGDLDFRTQSLYLSAVAAVSLGALAELTVEPAESRAFALESDEMSEAVRMAFDAVRSDDFVPLDTGGGEPGPYYQLAVGGVLHPVNFFADDDPLAAEVDHFLESNDRLSAGLPCFDDWGAAGRGDDAHYGIGYLLRCLRRGRVARFREGLEAMLAAGADDAVVFREVRPLGPQWGARGHLPGKELSRSEPCVGAVGAALVLLRHSWVAERFRDGWMPSREFLLFGGLGDEFWSVDQEFDVTFATLHGRVGLSARPSVGGWTLEVSAPPSTVVEVAAPPTGGVFSRIVVAGEPVADDSRRDRKPIRLPPGAPRVHFERVGR